MSSPEQAGKKPATHAPALRSGALSFRTLACLFAAVALSWTLRVTQWRANDDSFTLALICGAFLCVGIAVNRSRVIEAALRPLTMPLLAAAATFYIWSLFGYGPNEPPFTPLVSAAAVLFGLGLAANPKLERWRVPLILAVHAWLGIWRIQATPAPHIDVWVWHNEAIRALFDGDNPYAITMPNIYRDARFYDPSMVVKGRVLTGYQYPPLSLLFAIPGYLIGDYRYSQLFAMTVCGACFAYTRLGTIGATAMAMWLFSPGCLFILEQGYIEPMVAMLLALTLLFAVRWPRWVFLPLGLLFSSKQYMPLFAAPLVWLLPWPDLTTKGRLRLLLYASLVAAAVVLPFLIAGPKALFDCLVLLQLRQPFRTESLSLPAWWFAKHGTRLPDWLGFASLLPTCALVLWRSERSAAAFAAGVALVSFSFFALSKQAFGNYYFFTLAAICGAVAFAGVEPRSRPGRPAPGGFSRAPSRART